MVARADGQVELRPRTRAECPPREGGHRECPWQGCRHHLALQVTRRGRLYLRDADELEHHCTLDVVAIHPGGMTLEAIGAQLGVGRERVRQIEEAA